ncbi:MAG: preprotein translocase subunit YajC [Synergistes sp.]|nr:preprotein translocase subunit YajC [Synergistes sp.]
MQQGGFTGMVLPLVMFAAVFYFLIVRPQKKKQKAHDDMLASISTGDTVITAGGFFGIVRKVLDDSYLIELDEGTVARILKSSVSMKKDDGSDVSAQPKKKKKSKKTADGGAEEIEASASKGSEAEEESNAQKVISEEDGQAEVRPEIEKTKEEA